MIVLLHGAHDLDRFAELLRLLVGPVSGGQCFKHVGDGHHARDRRHLVLLQPFGVSRPVHLFMMPASNLRHGAQMFREGQALQHDDRLRDMIVDAVAFLFGQCSAADAQIIDLAPVHLVLGHIDLEAPRIVLCDHVFCLMRRDVVIPVCQQRFLDRQDRLRHTVHAPLLFIGNANTVAECSPPSTPGNFPDARDLCRLHELAAFVASSHEGKIVIQLLQ